MENLFGRKGGEVREVSVDRITEIASQLCVGEYDFTGRHRMCTYSK